MFNRSTADHYDESIVHSLSALTEKVLASHNSCALGRSKALLIYQLQLPRRRRLSCLQIDFKILLTTLSNDGLLLSFCIDPRRPCRQVMRIAFLLLLVAPLAGFPAPIKKLSSPYHLVDAQAIPNDLSPTCYRRWRHHGHLTFRLSRVQSCSGRTDQQGSSANTNAHPKLGHRAIEWVG